MWLNHIYAIKNHFVYDKVPVLQNAIMYEAACFHSE